jgi:hypothetical protein
MTATTLEITDPSVAAARFGNDFLAKLQALSPATLQAMAQHPSLRGGPLNPRLPHEVLAKLIVQRMTGKPALVCLGSPHRGDLCQVAEYRWRVLFVDAGGGYHPRTMMVPTPAEKEQRTRHQTLMLLATAITTIETVEVRNG